MHTYNLKSTSYSKQHTTTSSSIAAQNDQSLGVKPHVCFFGIAQSIAKCLPSSLPIFAALRLYSIAIALIAICDDKKSRAARQINKQSTKQQSSKAVVASIASNDAHMDKLHRLCHPNLLHLGRRLLLQDTQDYRRFLAGSSAHVGDLLVTHCSDSVDCKQRQQKTGGCETEWRISYTRSLHRYIHVVLRHDTGMFELHDLCNLSLDHLDKWLYPPDPRV